MSEPPRVITLIGYRGSGKSSVAPHLADRLDWDWADSDREIEAKTGRSIREIFAADGESFFRDLEREVIRDLASRDKLVIAAGGGIVLDANNVDALRTAGEIVWLTASPAVLAARLRSDDASAASRPSLTGAGLLEEIADVLAARESLYRSASDFVVDTEDKSPEELADEIHARLFG